MIAQLSNIEISSFLKRNDLLFNPPLSARLDIEDYSFKLTTLAKHFYYRDDKNLLTSFAACYFNDSKRLKAFLTIICVDKESAGKGFGKLLLDEVIHYGTKQGFKVLSLEVDKSNSKAIDFYLSYGFKILKMTESNITFMKFLK